MIDDALVDRLIEARRSGDFCPEWLPGSLTYDEALEVQLRLLNAEVARGDVPAGWKVGLTSERARKAVGADVRPFGYLLASRVFRSGKTIDISKIRSPSIEPELCFTFKSPLTGDLSRDEVAEAVEMVRPAFEINERRPGSVRPDLAALVVDRLTQWGIVEGEGVSLDEAGDPGAIRCTLECDGRVEYSGVSRDELDDHLESIRSLAAALAPFGRKIDLGQRVITGAFARRDCQAGQRWRAIYEPVGNVEVSFR